MAGMNERTTAASIQDEQIVTFHVAKELFGIGISRVKEIVRYPDITTVPRAPDYLTGLANLRGNVLPVVDARMRLGVHLSDVTDSTRVLVIDTGKTLTGVVVDGVKGVVSMENASIEAPPKLLASGVDVRYINNVIKTGNGEKIIMELEVENLCAINAGGKARGESGQAAAKAGEATTDLAAGVKEMQLVTFLVAEEEYGFPIESVREVLRVGRITEVPQAPSYVLGIFTVRDTLLPIVDIRKLFDAASLIDDITAVLDDAEQFHTRWTESLKQAVEAGSHFAGITDHALCGFGKWLETFRTSSEEIGRVIQAIRLVHQRLHAGAVSIMTAQKEKSQEEALKVFEGEVMPVSEQFLTTMADLKQAVTACMQEDQRVLVVETGRMPVGILVDRMQQVIRVPESIIDAPPTILGTEKSQNLMGVVKLDQGKRLIMLLDDAKILDTEIVEELKAMGTDTAETDGPRTAAKEDEIQLVTFRLGKEEFGLGIEDVQEINRLDHITSVPRAPSFVEGVMNLRGNVIPAIDLRKRFDMEAGTRDESTRVMIINMGGKLTGLIVDAVSEVIRLTQRYIEPPPEVIQGDSKTEFIKGLGKIDNNNRMILLIDVSKILSMKEQKELSRVSEQGQAGEATAGREPQTDAAPRSRQPGRTKVQR